MRLWKEVEVVIDRQGYHDMEELGQDDDKGQKEKPQRYLRSWGD